MRTKRFRVWYISLTALRIFHRRQGVERKALAISHEAIPRTAPTRNRQGPIPRRPHRYRDLFVFGAQQRFDLRDGFPCLTTKKLHLRSIIHELLWFLNGDTNIKYLNENRVTIWDEWADENGNLGRVYGAQWTDWKTPGGGSIDQIEQVIDQIKNNPTSRRLMVSAWNPGELHLMALPPCHSLFQFYVNTDRGELSCQLYQRSADLFLGVPFNIASYALLTMMVAQVCGLKPGDFVHTFGDLHLYANHIEQAKLQLTENPESCQLCVLIQGEDYRLLRLRRFRIRRLRSTPHD